MGYNSTVTTGMTKLGCLKSHQEQSGSHDAILCFEPPLLSLGNCNTELYRIPAFSSRMISGLSVTSLDIIGFLKEPLYTIKWHDRPLCRLELTLQLF